MRFLIRIVQRWQAEFVLRLSKLLIIPSIVLLLTVQSAFAELPKTAAADEQAIGSTDLPKAELETLFPKQLGPYNRTQDPAPHAGIVENGGTKLRRVTGFYRKGTDLFLVSVISCHQDTEAYALLTEYATHHKEKFPSLELTSEFGTASFAAPPYAYFFKGSKFVEIKNLNFPERAVETFAKAYADTIDKGEADIPALVKHLPNPEQSQKTARFLTRFKALQTVLPGQAVLSAIETDGNADAAFVDTGTGKVLIVEYNTPQLATENDTRVVAKIQELWKLGQPAPTVYKRVGNYSVFVFDAADEATAKKLIDQVKYEQVVQWLGDNPYIYKEAEKRYVETTLGVFVAVVKASGMALVACLGLGGLIGALLFMRRRAQQKTQEAYSDAGGMLRLNLDDLSAPQTDPARLLGPGR
jgi:hypothetical protein